MSAYDFCFATRDHFFAPEVNTRTVAHFMRFLDTNWKPMIAGSYALWLYEMQHGKSPQWLPNDVDILFPSKEILETAIHTLYTRKYPGVILSETDLALSAVFRNMRFQFLKKRHRLEDFDLNVCQIGINTLGEFCFGEDSRFAEGVLTLDVCATRVDGTEFCLGTLSRAFKYQERGYKVNVPQVIATVIEGYDTAKLAGVEKFYLADSTGEGAEIIGE